MAFNPTPEQEKAINRKGNILVSAAAGSGKTAVLVERVINTLKDSKRNINADELLIVTFTNAAAAEMRSRIEKRIDEECRNNPNSIDLLRQKHLLGNAKIGTIDSFCIDLVRENFDKLGISPDFKISDQASLNEINQRVALSILNRYITDGNKDFLRLVDLVGGEYDEKNLLELLLKVYEFSRQLPYPKKWYDEILRSYNDGCFNDKNLWYCYAFDKAETAICDMQKILANLVDYITGVPDAANLFLPSIEAFAADVDSLLESAKTRDWDVFYNHLNSFSIASLPAARGGIAQYREVKALKEAFKVFKEKTLPTLYKLFYADFDFINSQFNELYNSVKIFVDILYELDDDIYNEYCRQNMFTFHNIEHLALQLLCREDEAGNIIVSDDGKDLLEQYKEVMVDEYQDTNNLQDYLFRILSNFEEKLFVVGDVKQSIYAFRGANPENFLSKKQKYISVDDTDETMPQKIILANNFRTKAEVCDFINYFFEMFMTNKTGSINYDGEEQLIPTAKYPAVSSPAVNYSIIDCKDCEDKSWVLETRHIAQYIQKVMADGEVIKDGEDNLRKAKYSDFTILLRALTNAPYIINELRQQGIPVDLSLDSFADNREISTMLSLLRVIDNPDSDIELLTLLFSPIFSFSTDDIAEIRANKKDGTLYSAVINAKNNENAKAIDFLNKLSRFRLYSVSYKLPQLITKLFIETEFLNIISAFDDGEKRKNNLLILVEIAEQFVQNGGNNLSRFVEYVNRVSDQSGKAATASNQNAVKIMTIHGSKGLQFPVCILAGTDSRFNDEDAKHSACYSIKYGLGFKYFDECLKQPVTTISREAIIDSTKIGALQDELRLLYVALTRTQDKLLIVSSFKNFENTLEKYKNRLIMHGCEISKAFFNSTSSFTDWLIPSLLLHPNGDILRDAGDMLSICETNSSVNVSVIDGNSLKASEAVCNTEISRPNDDITQSIISNTRFVYPYTDILNMRSKTSVSALANKAESDKFAFSQRPAFMSKDNLTATDKGAAMHKVMQYFDFSKFNDIDTEIERLYEWQFISENEFNSLDRKALIKFFDSEIFERIQSAKKLEREMRFITEVSATLIDKTLDSRFNDEKIIIQGAIDALIIENDGIVILDFKTDRVEEPSALAEAYGMQLEIYALAAEKLFKLPVKEKLIYSFHLGTTVKV
ncbi:MAG: helicase-exonuclease AddAB subunit AddA [Clostridia bacterium]|nr:helicase-exonuclease AddAB subunit AddA [Clostridia bacterium]